MFNKPDILWRGASLWHHAYNLSKSVAARHASLVSMHRGLQSPAVLQKNFLVVIVLRKHLIPFRTQQLSSKTPMVLRGRLRGRVGCRQVYESLVTFVARLSPFSDDSYCRQAIRGMRSRAGGIAQSGCASRPRSLICSSHNDDNCDTLSS